MNERILTPSQIGMYVKGQVEHDPILSRISVRGELSNYRPASSGHHYFTLKDNGASLECVMFRSSAEYLRFRPQDGMQVVAHGQVTVYPRNSAYQLQCRRLEPDGIGDLAMAFEQMKARLDREGLFDLRHKVRLPYMPSTVALITSPTGAAVQDMIRILGARWPLTQVKIVPVRVQGAEAPGEIAAGIRWADAHGVADLIIVGRGGGSAEDLWAFNEEIVARAVYSCRTPIISAVGHEPDVSIADLVADVRAATPSNAAELAVPDQNEIYADILALGDRLSSAMSGRLEYQRQLLTRFASSPMMTDPARYFREKRMLLDHQSDRLIYGLEHSVLRQKQQLGRLAAALDAMSPLKVLGRGYAVARREDGHVLTSAREVGAGEKLNITLSDGKVDCRVL